MASQRYDVIVIGSGQAAGPLARAFAVAGRRTALIEREHVGGSCVNEGCTPTKTMVASARVAYLARRAADYGVRTGPVTVDMTIVRRRKRDIVASFRGGNERRIQQTEGLDLLAAEASFRGPRTLAARFGSGETRELTADTVVINTGLRPVIPDLPGIDSVPILDSTSIMELDAVPEHLLIIGGGYIGLEFGQMFHRFGSRVTIVQRGPRLIDRGDADVSDAVAAILREDGIDVELDTTAARVAPGPRGTIELGVESPHGERTLRGSHLLVAAGRRPNSERLDLAAAGIETDDRGFIRVNERLETNVPGIYAAGDVKGGPAFTHISYDDFRILRTNLIDGGSATTTGRLIPYTIYIDPQLGHVGLGEEEARHQGRSIRVARMPMRHVARALEVDETRGFMKAIVDIENDQILGFTCLGIEGGEIMSTVQMAMRGHLPYTALRDAIFAHPTLAESLNNLFASLATS